MTQRCTLSRSAFYTARVIPAPVPGLGGAQNAVEDAPVFIGKGGAGGLNGLQLADKSPTARGKFDEVGILKVCVSFNKSRFGKSVKQPYKMFEMLRIITRLIWAGVHAGQAINPTVEHKETA